MTKYTFPSTSGYSYNSFFNIGPLNIKYDDEVNWKKLCFIHFVHEFSYKYLGEVMSGYLLYEIQNKLSHYMERYLSSRNIYGSDWSVVVNSRDLNEIEANLIHKDPDQHSKFIEDYNNRCSIFHGKHCSRCNAEKLQQLLL